MSILHPVNKSVLRTGSRVSAVAAGVLGGPVAGKTAMAISKGVYPDDTPGVSVKSTERPIDFASSPPMSAASLTEARGQDKSRMKRQYGI
jgi:hypothetical protein